MFFDIQEVKEDISTTEIKKGNKQPLVVMNEKLRQKCKRPRGGEKNKKKTLEYTANARESMMRTISTSHLKAIFVEDDSV